MAQPCRCVGSAMLRPDARRPALPHPPSVVRGAPSRSVGPASAPPTQRRCSAPSAGPPGAALWAGCPRSLAPGRRRRCRAAAADGGGAAAQPRLRRGCAAGTAARRPPRCGSHGTATPGRGRTLCQTPQMRFVEYPKCLLLQSTWGNSQLRLRRDTGIRFSTPAHLFLFCTVQYCPRAY